MLKLKQNVTLTPFQGHIILYCKFHYDIDGVSRIEGLKRIWAIRYGYDYNEADNSMLEYIANDLFNIIYEICDIDFIDFQKRLHKKVATSNNEAPAITNIIIYYIYVLAFLTVADINSKTNRIKPLIKLPTPKKRVFKRILKGKGVYSDYKLITE